MTKLRKVLLAGAPGSGKTTLAGEVSVYLKMAGHRSDTVAEFARAYISQCGLPVHAYEQLLMLEGQRRVEEELVQHNEFLICDSGTWFCYVYARGLSPKVSRADNPSEWLKYEHLMHEIWLKTQEHLPSYTDIFFVPYTGGSVMKDGVRHDESFGRDAQRRLQGFLDSEGVPYTIVAGSLKKKTELILRTLGVNIPKTVSPSRLHTASGAPTPSRPSVSGETVAKRLAEPT